jgi:hypothetical protein
METLQAYFAKSKSRDIHTMGRYIQQHIDENWQAVYEETREEMLARYPEIGDSVYGIYGAHLFRHVHSQLKEARLKASPRLPGSFTISREWGPEDERQRWMWSKVITAEVAGIGTIVTAFFHDHTQIRIPRPFLITALEVTSNGAVIKALSRISAEFRDAREAKIEIAEYLAQLAQNSASTH